jgi:formamidopyrimidine-DNA glycosylase
VLVKSQNGDHRPTARRELQRKLRSAAELEVRVGAELDRLLSLAFEQGWTDRQIADASPHLSLNAVQQARSQGGFRRPPIFCRGCNDPIQRTGRRGRPPVWCARCHP